MNASVHFIAVDVDDNLFHGCGLNRVTGETQEFTRRPSAGHLIKKLQAFQQEGIKIRVCYEATYLGAPLKTS